MGDGLKPPLGEFNAVTVAREDMEKLFGPINRQLNPDDQLSEKKLSAPTIRRITTISRVRS